MRYIISFLLASAAVPALADTPRVVTDLPPVHALVSAVMGELGTPEQLLDQGADAHAFQLRPSQARALSEANLVVWVGPQMTPWLERALDGLASDTARLTLLDQPGTTLRSYGAAHHVDAAHHDHDAPDDHADHANHDEHAHHDEHIDKANVAEMHDGHDHGGTDPHAWLDPANAMLWANQIAAELGRLDPDNAATYTANAAQVAAEIEAADKAIAARLLPLRDRPFIVFHDAYGYFTDHYGLTAAQALALGDASAPGAARVSALRDEITGAGSICLFPEVQHDPALLEQLAEGTGARIGAPLDPEGSSVATGPGAYTAILSGLADALTDCLGK